MSTICSTSAHPPKDRRSILLNSGRYRARRIGEGSGPAEVKIYEIALASQIHFCEVWYHFLLVKPKYVKWCFQCVGLRSCRLLGEMRNTLPI